MQALQTLAMKKMPAKLIQAYRKNTVSLPSIIYRIFFSSKIYLFGLHQQSVTDKQKFSQFFTRVLQCYIAKSVKVSIFYVSYKTTNFKSIYF